MRRTTCWASAVLLLAAAPSWAADALYSVKTATAAPPKELKEPVAKLLSDKAVQFLDKKGELIGELWFRQELPSKATADQIKNGLTYRELEETTLLGAVRLARQVTDYRKQKINPGVYTLRLAFQPMDGDHMGTAPFSEFCLLTPAADDGQPAPLGNAKELHEKSAKSVAGGSGHPAVFMLVPDEKPADEPKLTGKANNWVLHVKGPVNADGRKAALGIGLTLIGHAD